jgi:glyoxylase-like metal-dependent hydrolase (beta-lactamase superfamily II)
MTRIPDGVTRVADGVTRLARAGVNCYLVDLPGGAVLIDAGLPRSWSLLRSALAATGRTPDALTAIYLTHGHFDHVGMADRLWREHHVPLHIHERDVPLAQHPYRYAHERARLAYPFRYPAAIPALARMTAAGALAVKGVTARGDVVPGEPLEAASELVPVFSPGHTYGHCAFFLPSRGVLFSGDALVTFDPYTGAEGPRAVARAATADSAAALAHLDALAATDAALVLPGHGGAWDGGIVDAVARAREAGVA